MGSGIGRRASLWDANLMSANGSGGWGSLAALKAEVATWRQPPGTECPNDGTPLIPARGELFCPFDGWTGNSRDAYPAGPARQDDTTDPYTATYGRDY